MISRRTLFAWLTGAAIAPVVPLPVQAQWTRRSGMLKVGHRIADPCLLDALMGVMCRSDGRETASAVTGFRLSRTPLIPKTGWIRTSVSAHGGRSLTTEVRPRIYHTSVRPSSTRARSSLATVSGTS